MQLRKLERVKKSGIKSQYSLKDYQNKIIKAKLLMNEACQKNTINKLKVSEAIGLYHEASEIDPSQAEPYLAMAYICWKFEEFEDAMALLKTLKKYKTSNKQADILIEQIQKDYDRFQFSKKQSKADIKTETIKNEPKGKFIKKISSNNPYDNILSQVKKTNNK